MAVLFMVAVMGATLAVAGILWSTAKRREKECELLYVGNAFRRAIGSYYEGTPGATKRYPPTLDDLLLDKRQLAITRYLRRRYRDPMSLKQDWGIVKAPNGGIMGVFSHSEEEPLKRSGFRVPDSAFQNAKRYSEWRFIYEPAVPVVVLKGRSS